MQTKRLFTVFLVVFLVFSLIPFLVHAAPDTYQLQFDCNKPDFYVKGETITIYGRANGSVSLTLNVFWNWKSFSDNILVYNNTRVANATWTLPTMNSNVGYYRFVLLGANQTVTIWRTLIHYTGYQVDSLPFDYSWQGVNYTLQGRHLYAQSNDEWLNLTYPKIPFQFSVNFFRNNMTFLVRLSGSGWAVDVCYMALYSGLKWTINGTLDNPQTFEFQCANNPLGKWAKRLDQWKGKGFLTFDWSDIRRVGQAFSWTGGVLSVVIPSSFNIDPYIFSDGFESGNFSAWTSESESGAGITNAVASNFVHHGSYSYEVQGISATGEWATLSKTLSTTYTDLYMRTYMSFNDLPTATAWVLGGPSFKSVTSVNLLQTGLSKDATGRKWLLRLTVGGSEANYLAASYVTLYSDQQYCVEVFLHRDNTTGYATLWVDEEVQINATSLNLGNSNIQYAQFATYTNGNEDPACVFIYDCVVVDSAYIGLEVEGLNLVFTISQSIYPSTYNLFGKELAFSLSHSIYPSDVISMGKAMSGVLIEYLSTNSIYPSANLVFNKELAFWKYENIFPSATSTMGKALKITLFELFDFVKLHTSNIMLPTWLTMTIDVAVAIAVLALVLSITGISIVFLRRRRDQ